MSTSDDKQLTVRGASGPLARVGTSTSAKPSSMTPLDEDAFTENMSAIIRRDFFPDLPKLEMQLEYIKASEEGDFMRMKELSARMTHTPGPGDLSTPSSSICATPLLGVAGHKRAPAESNSKEEAGVDGSLPPSKQASKPSDTNLDMYLSKYHSEDDASFAELMEKTQQKHKEKFAWLYEQEEKAKQYALEYQPSADGESTRQLAITDGTSTQVGHSSEAKGPSSAHARTGQVKTWAYTAKNALMYIPEGMEMTAKEKLELPGAQREILHSNTRLSKSFLSQMKNYNPNASETGAPGQPPGQKIGVDGNLLDKGDGSPSVNGYGFVSTPVIEPGVDASPLMTWGTIEGTPVQLDGGGTPLPSGGPSFKMPTLPKREALGMKLSERASKAFTERKKKALEQATTSLLKSSPSLKNALSTPTATDRLKLLSPAARKLAQKATPTRSVDQSLRSSYTPSHTPSASPLVQPQTGAAHRRRKNASTPSITVQGKEETQGSRTPSTPLLSDNLLQLNK